MLIRALVLALALMNSWRHSLSVASAPPSDWNPYSDGISSDLVEDRYLDKFVVLRQHRLLFCLIEKVGNTGFAKIFRRVKQLMPVFVDGNNLWRRHTPKVYNLTVSQIAGFIQDPSWLKAVFYREPLSRFLSAYRSKCGLIDRDGGKMCQRIFGRTNVSFHEAVREVYSSGEGLADPHFAPQASFCGGLNRSIHHYSHVHPLDPFTSRSLFIGILTEANVSISKDAAKRIDMFFPIVKKKSDFLLTGKHFGADHQTHSNELATLLEYYKEPCYVRGVVMYYQADYDLFRIPIPDWAQSALASTTHAQCVRFIGADRLQSD